MIGTLLLLLPCPAPAIAPALGPVRCLQDPAPKPKPKPRAKPIEVAPFKPKTREPRPASDPPSGTDLQATTNSAKQAARAGNE